MAQTGTLYTIGHSTHTLEEYFAMLDSFHIELLADVRSLPGSRKFPWFDKENLMVKLPEHGIEYRHFLNLGGRRKVKKDSHNLRWHHPAFRGYADYMETEDFETAIAELQVVALEKRTAIMCAEAVWWRCHRSMISDYMKAKGWTVLHIMAPGKAKEHPFTQPARVVEDHVYYFDEDPLV